MYITINDIIGEKRIDLSYPIHSFKQRKEIAVIIMLSNNTQYEVVKPHTILNSISPDNKKLILSKTYAGRELLSMLEGMIELTQFENDERVNETNKLRGITEMFLNPILLGGGGEFCPLMFFFYHPETAQAMKLKLFDFDTCLRHILQVIPDCYILQVIPGCYKLFQVVTF